MPANLNLNLRLKPPLSSFFLATTLVFAASDGYTGLWCDTPSRQMLALLCDEDGRVYLVLTF